MELRPGYKQTELGVIPEEWEVRRIGEIASIATGSTPPTSDATNYGDDFFFVSPVDLGETKLICKTEKRLSRKGFSAARRFPEGSVLFVCIGSTIGKCGVASVELTSNQQINAIFPSSSFSSDFLFYSLSAAALRIKSLAGEQAVPLINKSQFSESRISLPSILEQRVIAEALNDVDALMDGLGRLIAKKRDLKQAAMQQLLTGQTRLPGFSGEWEEKRFGEIAQLRMERVDPKQSEPFDFCVELEHIEQGTGRICGSSPTTSSSSLKSIFRPRDVLFGKLRAYLRKYWFADRGGVCSTEIWVLTPQSTLLTSEYLFHVVTDVRFIEAASTAYGTHMPRSDWNVVKNYEVRLPALPEQTAIAAVLSDMDTEITAFEQRRDKTRALKQAMMQELLTGRTRLV